jgi:hypothetical protein
LAELLELPAEVRSWREREVEKFSRFGWPSSIVAANQYAAALTTQKCPDVAPFVKAAAESDASDATRLIARVANAAGCAPCEQVLTQGLSPVYEVCAPWSNRLLSCAEREGQVELALPTAARLSLLEFSALTNQHDHSVVDTVLARYWYGRLLQKKGDVAAAKAQYESFLASWGNVDIKSEEVTDARARLAAMNR